MRRVARAVRTVGILLALFVVGFLGFYLSKLSNSRLGSEPVKLISVTSAPSPGLKELAAPSVPSSAATSPLTDQSVRFLAYAAASADKAARATLEAQAAKDVPAAEYGLGLFYFTKAQELSPITPCFAASGNWLRKHSPEAARAQEKIQSAVESELESRQDGNQEALRNGDVLVRKGSGFGRSCRSGQSWPRILFGGGSPENHGFGGFLE